MSTEAWYAYAVMAAGEPLPRVPPILPGASFAALPAGAVSVLASPVPRALFDRDDPANRTADPAWVASRAQAHHEVVCAAGPCLPFAFGALFSGVAPLLDWAMARGDLLAEALAELGARSEWSLTLREDPTGHVAHLCKAWPEVAALEQRRAGAGPGTAFLLGRRLEQLLPAARAARLDSLATALSALVRAEGLEVEPGARGGRLTALADEEEIAAARPALEEFGGSLAGTGVSLELSGPWPAYSFSHALLAAGLAEGTTA